MPLLPILPHSAGTALRIRYVAPPTAQAALILRKRADTFTGPDDPDATLIRSGMSITGGFLDTLFLTNGVPYFYKSYWTADGLTWTAESTQTATPTSNYQSEGVDALTFLRERLDGAMQTAVARGVLSHPHGVIPVLTAPPASEDTIFPVVTLHLASEHAEVRGIGETMGQDWQPTADSWRENTGWLARVQIAVVGWSMNPDERDALRRILREAVIANLEVFDSVGFVTVDFSQQNIEDFQSFNAPIYQSIGQFSCLAPVVVGTDYGLVNSTDTNPFFTFTPLSFTAQ